MNNKKLLFTTFILVACLQLFVPAKMIFDKENVIMTGSEYRFKTAPIDPYDPFRGKYITLNFEANSAEVPNAQDWTSEDVIYVSLSTDNKGFAKIKYISKVKPTDNQDYVIAKVSYVYSNRVTIEYPFDRFYMEESKAFDAELTYRESQLDTNQVAYALVSVKNGDAALKDVLIDKVSIREIVKKNQEDKK